MVATIGFMVQKYHVHFPLYLGPSGSNVFHPSDDAGWFLSQSAGIKFSDIADMAPLDAVKAVPVAGWLQILFVAGWCEAVAYQKQVRGAPEKMTKTPPSDHLYVAVCTVMSSLPKRVWCTHGKVSVRLSTRRAPARTCLSQPRGVSVFPSPGRSSSAPLF